MHKKLMERLNNIAQLMKLYINIIYIKIMDYINIIYIEIILLNKNIRGNYDMQPI